MMKKEVWAIVAIGWLVLTLVGCESPDTPEPGPNNTNPSAHRVLIGNEGGFTYGNASMQVYDPGNDLMQEDVFQAANQRPLGDVLQDVSLIGDRLYLVLNNSNRIEVIDTSDFTLIGSITGLASPRYILPVSDQKCYVTDFLAEAIHIIDPLLFEKTGEIPLPGWTEELIMVDDTVWVTNRQSDYVFLIDPTRDEVIDSVQVAYGPGAIGQDGAGFIWVYCAGDAADQRVGGLFRIDPITRRAVQSYELSADAGLFPRLAFDADRDTLFYLQDGIQALNIESGSLPSQAYIPAEGRTWYGLGYDPSRHQLWVGDAKDYQRLGDVYRFDRRGQVMDQLPGGVIPAIFEVLD